MFQKSVIDRHLKEIDKSVLEAKFQAFQSTFANSAKQKNIRASKEEQYQEGFIRELFCKVLGYTIKPDANYNIFTEAKNEVKDKSNSKKADAAICEENNEEKIRAVIELKGMNTTDLDKVAFQAFSYKNFHTGCSYVIVSNFERLRFYVDVQSDYVEFNLFDIAKSKSDLFSTAQENFALLYLLLSVESIKSDVPLKMKMETVSEENEITDKFYRDYSSFKRALFVDICERNAEKERLLLFKKTQKLLDRIIFIRFCSDRGLLPPNSVMGIIADWKQLKTLGYPQPLYNLFKTFFERINHGFVNENDHSRDVFAYNGGLFKTDDILDAIEIGDDVLKENCEKIAQYDFESQISVDILGRIFENSLTEIEEVQAELTSPPNPLSESARGNAKDARVSKRKKDGVFYTPHYITKYIVENTIGKLCAEKRNELRISDEDFNDESISEMMIKSFDSRLASYREWLLNLKILDPACGSGAFLNAALKQLQKEHELVGRYWAKIHPGEFYFENIDNAILENNLFGVDINEESVEIAKLSLWLGTAKKNRKLSSLGGNIKCGNSLISDKNVAGEKAFDWKNEFPEVFGEDCHIARGHAPLSTATKRVWHITTATHDSRTSQRMIDYNVRARRDKGLRPNAEPIELSSQDELLIIKTVAEIAEKDHLQILAFNVCLDHIHLLLVCAEDEVSKIVGKIKAMTSRAVNIANGRTVQKNSKDACAIVNNTFANKEHGETQCSLWTQKFGCEEVFSYEHIASAINYIEHNREKHGLSPLPQDVYSLIKTVNIETAFEDVSRKNIATKHTEKTREYTEEIKEHTEEIKEHTEEARGHAPLSTVSSASPLSQENGEKPFVASPLSQENGEKPFVASPLSQENGEKTFVASPLLQENGEKPFSASPLLRENGEKPFSASPLLQENGEKTFGASPLLQENGEKPFSASPLLQENGEKPFIASSLSQENGEKPFVASPLLRENGEKPFVASPFLQENGEKPFVASPLLQENGENPFSNGGFDVIIGNPPWGAALSEKEKKYLSSFHDVSLNTAYLFIEKALSLTKPNGMLFFIIPKGLSYVPSLKTMRDFLKENYSVDVIIDTSESFKDSGVELEAIMILITKEKSPMITTGYCLNKKFITTEIEKSIALTDENFAIWLNKNTSEIVKKIKSKSVFLGDICTSKRGINVNKYVRFEKESISDVVVLGGKTISNYSLNFLTYAPESVIEEKHKWCLTPKIMLQEIVGRVGSPLFGNFRNIKLNAALDEKGEYYTLDTVVNLFSFKENYDIKFVLAILNSNLIRWYFHVFQKNFSQLTIHSGNENSRTIPIPAISPDEQKPFVELADKMLNLNAEVQKKCAKFLSRARDNLGAAKITSALQEFYTLDFAGFVKELGKQKIKLSLKEQDEWEEYFDDYKADIAALTEQIEATDKAINAAVYALYGLSAEEISAVEG